MPNEIPELTPHAIDRIMTDLHDEGYHKDLAEREVADADRKAAQESDARTDRLLQLVRSDQTAQEPRNPAVFEMPPQVEAGLGARAEEYDRRWEIEAAKSTPRTDAQLREELARAGLHRDPPTEGEVAAQEEARLAGLRNEVATKNADKVHTPRTQVSARTHPALSPGVRSKPGYDKEQDLSNSQPIE